MRIDWDNNEMTLRKIVANIVKEGIEMSEMRKEIFPETGLALEYDKLVDSMEANVMRDLKNAVIIQLQAKFEEWKRKIQ